MHYAPCPFVYFYIILIFGWFVWLLHWRRGGGRGSYSAALCPCWDYSHGNVRGKASTPEFYFHLSFGTLIHPPIPLHYIFCRTLNSHLSCGNVKISFDSGMFSHTHITYQLTQGRQDFSAPSLWFVWSVTWDWCSRSSNKRCDTNEGTWRWQLHTS